MNTGSPSLRDRHRPWWVSLLAVMAAMTVGVWPAAASPEVRPADDPPPASTVVVDPTWNVGGAVGGTVTVAVAQPDGKVLIAGEFEVVDGQRTAKLARLTAGGRLDASFTAATNGDVRAIAVQPDGRIVIGGTFTEVNGTARVGVARLLPDGSLDAGFDPLGGISPTPFPYGSRVAAVAVDGAGRVIIAGMFNGVGGQPHANVARLLATGAPDPAFTPVVNGPVHAATVQPDGRVVLGGDFTAVNGAARIGVARLNVNGTIDAGYATEVGFRQSATAAPGIVRQLLLRPDGRVVAVGEFDSYNGTERRCMASLLANGALDVTFQPGTVVCSDAMLGSNIRSALAPDGTIITTGQAWFGRYSSVLVRLQPDGTVVPSFSTLIDGSVSALAVRPDGVVVVGAYASVTFGRDQAGPLFGVLPSGRLDTGEFLPNLGLAEGADGAVCAVARQRDGKMLVAGYFQQYGGVSVNSLVRLNADGSLDRSFIAGPFTSDGGYPVPVTDVAVAPNGAIVAVGYFTTVAGQQGPGIVKLLPTGAVDPNFYATSGFDGIPSTVEFAPDGMILVGGQFSNYSGHTTSGMARIYPSGAYDHTFVTRSATTFAVFDFAVQPDGKIVVVGRFDGLGGVPRRNVMRVNTNGSVDLSFDPGSGCAMPDANAYVGSVVLATDGSVVIGGNFTMCGGQVHGQVARLRPDGSADPGFDTGTGFTDNSGQPAAVDSVAVQRDGSVVVAGRFNAVGGVSRPGLARLLPNGTLDPAFLPGTGFEQDYDYSYSSLDALDIADDGRITVGGWFSTFDGAFPRPVGIVRLLATPSAPTGLSVANGDGQALVSFTPPASVVDRYEYSVDGGPWVAAPPAVGGRAAVLGLANGQPAQVRLRGVNAAGPGTASEAVTVTPRQPVGAAFTDRAPTRVLDTRAPGGGGVMAAGESRVVSVAADVGGAPVVPAGAVAVAYNITAASPAAAGHLRVMPGDVTTTAASTVNFRGGESIANAAAVRLPPDRTIRVYASASTHVVIDVVGYYLPGAGALFTPLTPVRTHDSALDPAGPLPPDTSRLVSTATGIDGVTPVAPAGAVAVAYNVTVTDTAGGGHLRVMPGDTPTTPTSALNWTTAGERIANASVVGLDDQRRIRLYNGSAAPVRVLVDVVGYYSATGAQFFAVDPVRADDTRAASGGAGPIAPGPTGVRPVQVGTVAGFAAVPAGAAAVTYNATVTGTRSPGHLRVYPFGAAVPNASVVNWPAPGYTRANASAVAVSPDRQVNLYNGASADIDVVTDVNGYFR